MYAIPLFTVETCVPCTAVGVRILIALIGKRRRRRYTYSESKPEQGGDEINTDLSRGASLQRHDGHPYQRQLLAPGKRSAAWESPATNGARRAAVRGFFTYASDCISLTANYFPS